jgi:phosphate uptake regulator
MQRKALRVGKNSTAVSLPGNWVKLMSIKPGDELNLEVAGGKVTISPDKPKESHEKIIVCKGKSKFLRRYVNMAYKQGYDLIKISFDTPIVLEKINKELDELTGFEIVKFDKTSCEIKTIIDESEETFEVISRRLFYLAEEMANESLLRLKNGGKLDLTLLESKSNKLANLLERVINSKKHGSDVPLSILVALVLYLEGICDSFRDLAGLNKIIIIDTLIDYHEKINTFLSILHKTYYSPDKEAIILLKKKRQELLSNGEKLISKIKFPVALHHLLTVAEKMHHIELLIQPI